MKVYATAERARHGTSHLHVAPAAHLPKGDLPAAWTDEAGEPVQFTVVFREGEAVVTAELGRYLIDQGFAKRTKLWLPGLAA